MRIENMSNTCHECFGGDEHTLGIFITDDDGSWGMAPKVSARTPLRTVEIRFHDIESTDEPGTIFSEMQANTLVAWLNKHLEEDDIDTIRISCDGGVSRSSAMAAAIAIHLGEETTIFDNPRFCPNRHVFDTMLKALSNKPKTALEKAEIDELFDHNLEIWTEAHIN